MAATWVDDRRNGPGRENTPLLTRTDVARAGVWGARDELHGDDPGPPHTPAGALQPLRRRARACRGRTGSLPCPRRRSEICGAPCSRSSILSPHNTTQHTQQHTTHSTQRQHNPQQHATHNTQHTTRTQQHTAHNRTSCGVGRSLHGVTTKPKRHTRQTRLYLNTHTATSALHSLTCSLNHSHTLAHAHSHSHVFSDSLSSFHLTLPLYRVSSSHLRCTCFRKCGCFCSAGSLCFLVWSLSGYVEVCGSCRQRWVFFLYSCGLNDESLVCAPSDLHVVFHSQIPESAKFSFFFGGILLQPSFFCTKSFPGSSFLLRFSHLPPSVQPCRPGLLDKQSVQGKQNCWEPVAPTGRCSCRVKGISRNRALCHLHGILALLSTQCDRYSRAHCWHGVSSLNSRWPGDSSQIAACWGAGGLQSLFATPICALHRTALARSAQNLNELFLEPRTHWTTQNLADRRRASKPDTGPPCSALFHCCLLLGGRNCLEVPRAWRVAAGRTARAAATGTPGLPQQSKVPQPGCAQDATGACRERVHWKKRGRSWWKNADIQQHTLGRETEEIGMVTSPANCHPQPRTLDQVEPGTYHVGKNSKKSRKTSQEMGPERVCGRWRNSDYTE